MNELLQQMWHTWSNGGWVMAAMALLAVVMYASAIHLLMALYYRGITKASDPVMRGWISHPDRAPSRLRELIRYTQEELSSVQDLEGRFREVEAARIPDVDRRIAFLNVMVIAAPLFGLLGTVLGMLLTFQAIGVGGSSTSEVISRGISEALVCTQSGMMVAIPGLILATVAKRWRNEYVGFLARLESVSLRHFRLEPEVKAREAIRRGESAVEPFPANNLPEVAPA